MEAQPILMSWSSETEVAALAEMNDSGHPRTPHGGPNELEKSAGVSSWICVASSSLMVSGRRFARRSSPSVPTMISETKGLRSPMNAALGSSKYHPSWIGGCLRRVQRICSHVQVNGQAELSTQMARCRRSNMKPMMVPMLKQSWSPSAPWQATWDVGLSDMSAVKVARDMPKRRARMSTLY